MQEKNDPFVILGLERRPWIDEEKLKQAFHERARILHPDAKKADKTHFVQLNSAYTLLKDPAKRLRCLLARISDPSSLEQPQVAVNTVENVDLFMRVGATLQTGKEILEKFRQAKTIILQAVLKQEAIFFQKRLVELEKTIEETVSGMKNELQILDQQWPKVASERVESLAVRFEQLSKWQCEIEEQALAFVLESATVVTQGHL